MQNVSYYAINDTTYCVDMLYPIKRQTAAYIIIENGAATIIDCGAKQGDQLLINALMSLGLKPKDVRWLIVTHAHLDHAGSAGQLMQILPEAIFCGHPAAIKHLINPNEKLVPASTTLYGSAFFKQYYGRLLPIDSRRTRCLEDCETIKLSAHRYLKTIYTYGHAWHHISLLDINESLIFSGDAYGISYTSLTDSATNQPLIVPVTPPTQFNPAAMAKSIELIYSSGAKTAALSHFSPTPINDHTALMLQNTLERWLELAKTLWQNGKSTDFISQLRQALISDLKKTAQCLNIDANAAAKRHEGDILLSAKGFDYYLRRQQPQN